MTHVFPSKKLLALQVKQFVGPSGVVQVEQGAVQDLQVLSIVFPYFPIGHDIKHLFPSK